MPPVEYWAEGCRTHRPMFFSNGTPHPSPVGESAKATKRFYPFFLCISQSFAYFVKTLKAARPHSISPWRPSIKPRRRTYILRNRKLGRKKNCGKEARHPLRMRSSAAHVVKTAEFLEILLEVSVGIVKEVLPDGAHLSVDDHGRMNLPVLEPPLPFLERGAPHNPGPSRSDESVCRRRKCGG